MTPEPAHAHASAARRGGLARRLLRRTPEHCLGPDDATLPNAFEVSLLAPYWRPNTATRKYPLSLS